jgi:hypothetical protein
MAYAGPRPQWPAGRSTASVYAQEDSKWTKPPQTLTFVLNRSKIMTYYLPDPRSATSEWLSSCRNRCGKTEESIFIFPSADLADGHPNRS